MARLDALIERWGNLAALALGAVVLFVGLGRTGLWEPWEMERADLARTLAAPPEAVIALGPGLEGTAELIERAARDAGVVIRRPEAAGGGESMLAGALDLARTRVVASVVIDLHLLFPAEAGGVSGGSDTAWAAAAQRISEASRYAAAGTVVLVHRDTTPIVSELRQRLALERWRATWRSGAAAWQLEGLADAAAVEAALARRAGAEPDDAHIHVVSPTDVAGLTSALAAGASGVDGHVAFKDRGDTVSVPPLETWLRVVAYRALGPTELATRLPVALLAFLALWVLVATLRTLWGGRVALVAGVVLATMPLFYAQGRIVQGEAGFVLALTLVAASQLLGTRKDVPRFLPAAYLGAGLVIGLLSKGLFAGVVVTGLALAGPLIAGERVVRAWLPAIAAAAVTGLVWLLVAGADPGTFFAQLGLQVPRFDQGAGQVPLGFDLVIAQLGFGMSPWSPLVVAAVGAVAWWAVETEDKTGLIVALWFFVPLVAVMVGFRTGNHFFYAGAPAAAAAVGLFADRVIKRGVPAYFLAAALVLMYVILRHDLKEAPQAMVGWLTWEHPFSKDGANRFPETLSVPSAIRWALLVAGVVCAAHFGRILSALLRAMSWLRRDEAPDPQGPAAPRAGAPGADLRPKLGRPLVVAIAACLVLAAVIALFVIGQKHGPYMGSRFADSIGPSEKLFVGRLTSFSEPIFLVTILSILVLVVAAILRFGFGKGLPIPAVLGRWGLPVGAALWVIVALVLALSTTYPDDFWGETLTGLPSLFGYVGAIGFAALVWVLGRQATGRGDRLHAGAALVGALGFLLLQRLVRDANWRDSWVTLGVFFGWVGVALTLLPAMIRSSRHFAIAGAVLGLVFAGGFIVPLADRWAWLRELSAEPGGFVLVDPLAGEIVGALVPAMVLALVPLLLLGWRALNRPGAGRRAVQLIERGVAFVERPPALIGAMALVGVAVTAITLLSFVPRFAINVSQKHIIDTWREAEPGADPEQRMFKLPFTGGGRKDSNFYTAGIPEIRDRQTALQVLLGIQDQVVTLETELGTESRLLQGFSVANDRNRDGRRDEPAITGFATAASDTTLTDASKRWAPGSLVGKRLVDAQGRSWAITGNDQSSVSVGANQRLTFATSPAKAAFYAIDADVPDPRATAVAPERRALLVPADSLSDINHQWRKLSGGRHLPVLDGSSYRVLLATSWLEGEEQQENRLALATFDDVSFAKITDTRLRRVWGNFDDTIQVVGYQLERATVSSGQQLRLTVYYKALKVIQKSWKIFIHLDRVGAGGTRIGGDHWPLNPTKHTEENKGCTGCFRTDHWLPGDIVQDTYDIEIPETSSGEYMIYVGFFEPGPDKRLALKDHDKKNTRHDGGNRLGIGTFNIR
ncbi:MAG: glycosyltransferase family 39 protein [Deltaproteobacteria bacterium]|nr:glycosyltransferase family 39 protein [Deltaproteobacteria bacterium]